MMGKGCGVRGSWIDVFKARGAGVRKCEIGAFAKRIVRDFTVGRLLE